jgi:hypothetical protein
VDVLLRAKPLAYATTFEELASDVEAVARWVPVIMSRS